MQRVFGDVNPALDVTSSATWDMYDERSLDSGKTDLTCFINTNPNVKIPVGWSLPLKVFAFNGSQVCEVQAPHKCGARIVHEGGWRSSKTKYITQKGACKRIIDKQMKSCKKTAKPLKLYLCLLRFQISHFECKYNVWTGKAEDFNTKLKTWTRWRKRGEEGVRTWKERERVCKREKQGIITKQSSC